jgi:hypothetical protein
LAERFGAVSQKVGAGDFALHEDGMAGALPADGVGHFAAGAGLLRQDYSATVTAQPTNGLFDKLGVGHDSVFGCETFCCMEGPFRKWLGSYH